MAELDREGILGLDNIRLELPVAAVGGRSLAAFVDHGLLAVLALVWMLACFTVPLGLPESWQRALAVVGLFVLQWGYFAIWEIASGGRTPGKLALGLRVVTAEGAAAGPVSLLARNLLRPVDLLVGLPLMALDPLSRRLGDRLGGTIVVHARRRERPLVLGRIPPGWGAREVALAESFLARAGELGDPVLRDTMARQLLGRVERDAPQLVAGIDRRDPVRALRGALLAAED